LLQKSEKGAAGYRAMERDTNSPSTNGATDSAEHIRPTADSSVSAAPNSDSSATTNPINVAMGTAAAVSSDSVAGANQSDTTSTEVSTSADSSAEGHRHPGAVVAGAAVVGGVAAAGNDREHGNQTEVSPDANSEREAPMARDTSTALAQGDTVAQAVVDTSRQVQSDTATIGDTAVILTQTDTTQRSGVGVGAAAGVAVGAAAAGDQEERVHADTVSKKADELAEHDSARVRPPADSTELYGNVTTDRAGANADAAAVGAAGVASTGNIATGAEAVAEMTRQGERCSVVSTDQHRDVLWDFASSPATLNPCGTGTMTLPKIWTGEKK
jgi:hypothetical protein